MSAVSGYITWYLYSGLNAVPQIIEHLGNDPAAFFVGTDKEIVAQIVAHNGLGGSWVKFAAKPEIAKRVQELNASIEAVDFSAESFAQWCVDLKQEKRARDAANILTTAQKLLQAGKTDEALTLMETKSVAVQQDIQVKPLPTGEQGALAALGIVADWQTGGNGNYAKTGYTWWDHAFGGFPRGAVSGLIGAPGCGKTALAGQFSFGDGRQKVAWVQGEMSHGEMYIREGIRRSQQKITMDDLLMHSASKDEYRRLQAQRASAIDREDAPAAQAANERMNTLLREQLQEKDFASLKNAVKEAGKFPAVMFCEANLNVLQIIASLKAAERHMGGLDLVFLDNLRLLRMLDKTVSRSSGNWFKLMIEELKLYLPQAFPNAAIVVLQHANSELLKGKAAGEDKTEIIPDMASIEGQTAWAYHAAYVITRPVQHKRQLDHIFAADNWALLSPEEQQQWERAAFVTSVKQRMTSNKQLKIEYVGERYNFTGVKK